MEFMKLKNVYKYKNINKYCIVKDSTMKNFAKTFDISSIFGCLASSEIALVALKEDYQHKTVNSSEFLKVDNGVYIFPFFGFIQKICISPIFSNVDD